jgi:hypothetical protein
MGAPASKDVGAIEDGDAAATPVHRAQKPRPRAAIVARGACDEGRVSLVLPFATDAAVTVGQDQPIIQGQQVDGACYLATPPPDPAASVARPQPDRAHSRMSSRRSASVVRLAEIWLTLPLALVLRSSVGFPSWASRGDNPGLTLGRLRPGRKATMKLTTPRAPYRLNRGRPASLGQEAKRPIPGAAHAFWHPPDPLL